MPHTQLSGSAISAQPSPNKRLSLLRVLTTVAFVLCVLYASMVRLNGDDFWLQAKIGELIAQNGAIPDTLLFPFTEIVDEKFNAHEWLMSVVFHYALTLLGEDGMPFLISLLGLVLFAVMARLCYVRTQGNYALALLGGYISLLAENYRHVMRPELPSLIMMALLLCNLEAFRSKPAWRPALWSCLLIALWANSHGSFILGPALVGIFMAGSYLDELRLTHFKRWMPSPRVWRFALLLMASLASCLLNPFGWELLQFVFSFSLHSEASKHLTEWLPTFDPRLRGIAGFWIALGVWALLSAFMLRAWRRLGAVEWLMFFFFTLLAYRAIRFPVYLGMVAAYVLPACLPANWLAKERMPQWLKGGMTLSLSTLLLVGAYGNASNSRIYDLQDRTKFTIPMVQVLSDPALHGNVLNSMELGAELIYRAYPRLRPSMDCRVDSYGFEYATFNTQLLANESLLSEFVQRYDVRYLLMPSTRFDKFQELASWKSGKWRIYFDDTRTMLLQRADVQEGTPRL